MYATVRCITGSKTTNPSLSKFGLITLLVLGVFMLRSANARVEIEQNGNFYRIQPPPQPVEDYVKFNDATQRATELNGPKPAGYVWNPVCVDQATGAAIRELCTDEGLAGFIRCC